MDAHHKKIACCKMYSCRKFHIKKYDIQIRLDRRVNIFLSMSVAHEVIRSSSEWRTNRTKKYSYEERGKVTHTHKHTQGMEGQCVGECVREREEK